MSRHALVLLGAVMSMACGSDAAHRVTGPSEPPSTTTLLDVTPPSAEELWDQMAQSIVALSASSQLVLFADDFTVPAATTWSISDLVFRLGLLDVNVAPIITIRSSVGGIPGAVLAAPALTVLGVEFFGEPPIGVNMRAAPPAPIVLGTGTYWLTVEVSPFPGPGNIVNWYSGLPNGAGMQVSSDNGQTWRPFSDQFDFNASFALFGTAVTPVSETNDLLGLLTDLGLGSGLLTSLSAKLQVVLAELEDGDTAGACRALNDFANQVRAQSGKKLTTAEAESLLAEVAAIQQLLGC